MSEEEIRKLIWDWEIFSSKKENASINEEVLSEYINEYLNQNPDEPFINWDNDGSMSFGDNENYKNYLDG